MVEKRERHYIEAACGEESRESWKNVLKQVFTKKGTLKGNTTPPENRSQILRQRGNLSFETARKQEPGGLTGKLGGGCTVPRSIRKEKKLLKLQGGKKKTAMGRGEMLRGTGSQVDTKQKNPETENHRWPTQKKNPQVSSHTEGQEVFEGKVEFQKERRGRQCIHKPKNGQANVKEEGLKEGQNVIRKSEVHVTEKGKSDSK